jgi:hypothetical protein
MLFICKLLVKPLMFLRLLLQLLHASLAVLNGWLLEALRLHMSFARRLYSGSRMLLQVSWRLPRLWWLRLSLMFRLCSRLLLLAYLTLLFFDIASRLFSIMMYLLWAISWLAFRLSEKFLLTLRPCLSRSGLSSLIRLL